MTELMQFVIIGVAKCGTTSLHEYLRQNPKISLPRRKETHFFIYDRECGGFPESYHGRVITDYIDNLEDYLAEFENRSSASLFGEVCPSYFYYPNAAANIYKYSPNAKILCILRNPVYRLYSEYTYAQFRKDNPADQFSDPTKSFKQIAQQIVDGKQDELTKRRFETGFYTKFLSVYYDRFPSEQVKVLLFEDLRSQPDVLMDDLSQFIGAPGFDYNVNMRFNTSGKSMPFSFYNWLRKTKIKKFFRRNLSPKTYQSLRSFAERYLVKSPPSIDPESRAILQDAYRREILTLQKMIGRDLSSWLA